MGAAVSDYFTDPTDVSDGYVDIPDPMIIIHHACAKALHHTVSIYFKKGGDPNEKCFEEDDIYERDDTPMICAARGCPDVPGGSPKHLQTLEIVLLYGGDVNAYNKVHQTPLYVSIQKGYLNIAAWLIVNGADVDICDSAGVSPLLCAARLGRADFVTLLIESHAKVAAPQRRTSCLKFPSLANENSTFTPEIQELLAGALKVEAEAKAAREAARLSKENRAHMEALKSQLQEVHAAVRKQNVHARLMLAHGKRHEAVTLKSKATLMPAPSTAPKRYTGGTWVKKKPRPTASLADHFLSSPALNRIHSAPTEWAFVKAEFGSQDALRKHDLLQQSMDIYASLQRRKQLRGDPRTIQSAPDMMRTKSAKNT
ncbi:hypothetical protein ACHHYP_14467 [Achlya hypogyna]|uniref:Uncharacterized protein n=1 Tax=Achlya hypogyna TaxID=1202772 RepID=A0A1V9YD68_ACHHY|nr:hypothetical protein ACHHYP_14467 [Achlya hypogyna]